MLISLLQFLHGATGSYGLAIILLTIIVRLALYPLSLKQMSSMAAMQKVQPRIKVIQEKYANDKQKQNEEMMRLYRENNINPAAGCLPLLIQLPIMILLYGVLNRTAQSMTGGESFLGIDLSGTLLTGILKAIEVTPPEGEAAGLFYVLRQIFAHPAGMANVGYYLPTLIFIAAIGYMTWLQQKVSGATSNPQMSTMNVVMPIFMVFICLSLPGGVLIYWGTSTLVGIVQQVFVTRKTKLEMEDKPVLYKNKPQDGRPGDVIESVSQPQAPKEDDYSDPEEEYEDEEYEEEDDGYVSDFDAMFDDYEDPAKRSGKR